MIIAGIDYSMRSPSICVFTGTETESFCFERCKFYFLTDTQKYAKFFLRNISGSRFTDWNCEYTRFKSIADWAMDRLDGCTHIGLEGYSYIDIDIIAPTQIKKFATGKGNADKSMMHKSFVEEVGLDLRESITPDKKGIDNPVSDIVDSYFICKYLHDKVLESYTY